MAATTIGCTSTGSTINEILECLEAETETLPQGGSIHVDYAKLLTQLLSHTRSSSDLCLGPLFTRRGICILGRYAFEHAPSTEYRTALRCLNNILVRAVSTRQIFVDEGFPEKVLGLMKNGNPDEELSTANLLLLCSTDTSLDLVPEFEHNDLAGIINKNILRNANSASPLWSDPASTASLRLLSTLAVRYEAQAFRFLQCLHPILDMLNKVAIPSPPLQPPASLLIGCLAAIPISQSQSFPDYAVEKLTHILRLAILAPSQPTRERELMPLLMVLLHVAQSELPAARSILSKHLLPSEHDRALPLGQGNSLPHRLLKLSTASREVELRELILTLYFELSDKDSTRFVRCVGFGIAAGFLTSKGIQLSPDEITKDDITGENFDINPITGQKLDIETQHASSPEMTEEEKEREAERLFVLFERLKATGVVTVENPVSQVQRPGRVEELPDDESD